MSDSKLTDLYEEGLLTRLKGQAAGLAGRVTGVADTVGGLASTGTQHGAEMAAKGKAKRAGKAKGLSIIKSHVNKLKTMLDSNKLYEVPDHIDSDKDTWLAGLEREIKNYVEGSHDIDRT